MNKSLGDNSPEDEEEIKKAKIKTFFKIRDEVRKVIVTSSGEHLNCEHFLETFDDLVTEEILFEIMKSDPENSKEEISNFSLAINEKFEPTEDTQTEKFEGKKNIIYSTMKFFDIYKGKDYE